jgi:putative salt-induced outer membrane protein YdiY
MRSILPVAVLLFAPFVFADQVTLKNGDRLTGNIVKYDGKNLVLKSELAGDVTIAWTNVTGITSSTPLTVGLKGGQILVGPVTTNANGALQVTTEGAGTVSAARESVETIRNKDEQAAYQAQIDHYRNPRLVDLWTGSLDLGYAQSHGNANTQNFTLNAIADRATTRDKMEVHYTSIFAKSDATGPSVTTADAKRGGISYNLNLAPRYFVFGAVDLETDQFQALDLRFSPAGGGGYHVIKTERTALDAMLGGSLDREFFSTGLDRTFGEVLVGEEFTHKFGTVTALHEKLSFYPNLSDTGQYRMNFDATYVMALRKWLSWQVSLSDRYLSDPLPGFKTNDVLFTTGVRLSFTNASVTK